MAKQKKTVKRESDINVKLKTFAGIRPTTYVPVLYILGISLIIFLFLIVPGLKNNGTLMRFTSTPPGASVRVDGIRLGATPCSVFVEKGSRTVEISKPGYSTEKTQLDVKGRIFASRIFPRKDSFYSNHSLESPEDLLHRAFQEYSGWTYAGNPSAHYPIPRILSVTSADYYLSELNPTTNEDQLISNFSDAALPYAHSSFYASDWLKSRMVIEGRGSVLTTASLYSAITSINDLVNENPDAPLYIQAIAGHLVKTDYLNEKPSVKEFAGSSQANALIFGGMEFQLMPNDQFLLGSEDSSLIEADIDDFYLAATEVSNRDYYLFVQENGAWSPDNIDFLISEGLVSEDYLKHWPGIMPDTSQLDYPVTNISHFAALAYCTWFSAKFLNTRNLVADLPNETEWEYAAKRDFSYNKTFHSDNLAEIDADDPGNAGLHFMTGNVWEWMKNDYSAFGLHFPSIETEFNSTGASVRGGSWANPDPVPVSDRGFQPKYFCTPYLGFRLALRITE